MAAIKHAGKLINWMLAGAREELRDRLPVTSDGRIAYVSFANAVKARVP
jgi:hypothetical protein